MKALAAAQGDNARTGRAICARKRRSPNGSAREGYSRDARRARRLRETAAKPSKELVSVRGWAVPDTGWAVPDTWAAVPDTGWAVPDTGEPSTGEGATALSSAPRGRDVQ
jgi:hypothetical protein